jgi:hypothetical protein
MSDIESYNMNRGKDMKGSSKTLAGLFIGFVLGFGSSILSYLLLALIMHLR